MAKIDYINSEYAILITNNFDEEPYFDEYNNIWQDNIDTTSQANHVEFTGLENESRPNFIPKNFQEIDRQPSTSKTRDWKTIPVEELTSDDIRNLSKSERNHIIQELKKSFRTPETSFRIETTLCPVIFEPNGGFGFKAPCKFSHNNTVFNIVEDSMAITKFLFQIGRFWSIHEILCDVYERDPKTMYLSDEPLINLPLWDIGSPDQHVNSFAPIIFSWFYKILPTNLLDPWDEKSLNLFAEKFLRRINNDVYTQIFTSDGKAVQPMTNSLVKKKDAQKGVVLSGFSTILDMYMANLAKKAKIVFENEDNVMPYYSTVWKSLTRTMKNIVKEFRGNFTEGQGEQFHQILRAYFASWRQIWIVDNKISNLVNKFARQYVKEVLGLYQNNMDLENPTPYQYYNFIRYLLQTSESIWEVLPAEVIPTKRRRLNEPNDNEEQ